jgi:hypothetical protein
MKNITLLLCLLPLLFGKCVVRKNTPMTPAPVESDQYAITIPSLLINGTSRHKIAKAYRIAIGDISGNIQYHRSGLLDKKVPCLYAGLVYGKPWTRDAAINVWNGFGLLAPEVSKNTLMAQTQINKSGKTIIIGQYWDKIIWTIGAWNYYLYSGDKTFLNFAFTTTLNTLSELEKNEFSSDIGLFRGPAVYGDGVAAYPAIYTRHQEKEKSGSYSGIYEWAAVNDDLKHPLGYGIPMHTLSTNAVYHRVYVLLSKMAKVLDEKANPEWDQKAKALKKAVNQYFWDQEKSNYNYLIDPFGNCDAQEGMGIAFCLLFKIADEKQTSSIFETTVIEPAGIPCVYPSFPRYRDTTIDSYGRHSGTVWPHIQGFWAEAAMQYHRTDIFDYEFNALTDHAIRDFQFVEIYHPTKRTKYGGLQEPHLKNQTEWFCAERQTWSATAYLRMIFKSIIGMQFSESGISFQPYLPQHINEVSLLGLKYKNMMVDIHISGNGSSIGEFTVNEKASNTYVLNGNLTGKVVVDIRLE